MNETVSISLPGSRYLVLGLGLTGQAVRAGRYTSRS